jgi:hypothetical protein
MFAESKKEFYTDRIANHNTLQEIKGNVRVFCRVRPITNNDEKRVTKKLSKDYMPTSVNSKAKVAQLKNMLSELKSS